MVHYWSSFVFLAEISFIMIFIWCKASIHILIFQYGSQNIVLICDKGYTFWKSVSLHRLQILCISGGQMFNIRNRFYITFDTFLLYHLWFKDNRFIIFTVFVSGLLAGNAISVSLILMIGKFYVPIGITKLLSFSDLFLFLSSFLLMSLYYHSFCNLSTLLFVFSLIILFLFLFLY